MTRRLRTTVVATALAVLALLSIGVPTALAAWSAQALGAGSALSGTMPDGPAASAAVTGSDVLVSWSPITLSGGTPSDYVVMRYGANATAVTPASNCDGVVTTNQCTELNVAEGLWTYTIATAKGQWRGDEGASSTAVRMPTRAPSGLAADADAATRTSVSLSWTDNSAIEDGYLLQRSADGSTGWTTVANLAQNAQSGSDTGLTCGQSFSYRAIAVSAANQNSAPSNIAAATAAACPLAPAQPSGLTATAVSQTHIDLTWTDNATNEAAYQVEASTDGGATWAVVVSDLDADADSYAHTALTCGTEYHYRVTAMGAEGADSNASAVADAATQQCTTPPAAPSALGATTVSATKIDLGWTDNATNETHFEIERNGTILGVTAPAKTGTGSVSFQDTVACGTAYTYRVRAVNGDGPSALTATASATSQSCAPNAPTNLSITGSSATSVSLSWTDNAADETGFDIERTGGSGTIVLTRGASSANPTTYTDATAACGTAYTYRVRATNGGGPSSYTSGVNTTTTTCVPAAPTSLTASAKTVAGGDVSVDLSWTDNATNESGFDIERTGGTGTVLLTRVASTGNGTTTYNDDSAVCGATYAYRVRAANAHGNSAYSSTADATTVACDAVFVAEITTTASPQNATNWRANATVTIRDHSGTLVDGVQVSGAWSGGSSSNCTTGSGNAPDGQCSIGSGNILVINASSTFTITSVAPSGRSYVPSSNAASEATQANFQ